MKVKKKIRLAGIVFLLSLGLCCGSTECVKAATSSDETSTYDKWEYQQISQKGTDGTLVVHFCEYVGLYLDTMQIRKMKNDTITSNENVFTTDGWYMMPYTVNEEVDISKTDLKKWLPDSYGVATKQSGRTYKIDWTDNSDTGVRFGLYDDGVITADCYMYNYILKYKTYISTDSSLTTIGSNASWKSVTVLNKKDAKCPHCGEKMYTATSTGIKLPNVTLKVPDSCVDQYIYVEVTLTSGEKILKKTKVAANKDHDYKEEIVTDATCTKTGKMKKTCKVCGYETTETIAAKGHDYSGSYKYKTNNNVAKGLKYKNCVRVNNGKVCDTRLESYYLISLTKGAGIDSVTGDAVYKEYGESCSVSATPSTGYTFKNWSGTFDSTKKTYTFKMPEKAVALTANANINQSTLKVNPDGGIWNNSTETQTITKNYNTTISIPVPRKNGYEFVQWVRTGNYGTLSSLNAVATYKFGVRAGVTDTITAKWKDVTPPTSEITAVTDSMGNYTTDTYVNPYTNIKWFKDYLDAQITSYDEGSGVKENYLSDANSENMVQSPKNPYSRKYSANESDDSGLIFLRGFAVDNNSNRGQRTQESFYVDGAAPNIETISAVDYSNNGGVSITSEEGIIVVTDMRSASETKKEKEWKNVNIAIDISISDKQSGLLSAVLEKYNDAGEWETLNTVSYNGEIDTQTASFTITETGKYRIAVYDMLHHVSYTSETDYYIDKIPPTIDDSTTDPTITVDAQTYGWTNKEVPLHFDIAENINGSGIATLEFVKVLADGTEESIEISPNIDEDSMNATVDVTITEEGITNYKLYAKDNAGNESYVYITVKIDYTAPTADAETILNDSYALDVSLKDIVEELSGCDLEKTYFIIKDSEGNVPEVLTYKFNPDDYTNIYTGACFEMSNIDVMTKYETCDSIDVEIHIFDIAGNEQVYSNTVDIFKLEATLYRYMSEIDDNTGNYMAGETWKAGESGLVKIDAGAFIDRIEVVYPTEWIEKQADNVTYPLDHSANIYNYTPPIVKNHEEDEFMIPTAVDDDGVTYTIIVRAYKTRNGIEKMKEIELPLVVKDNVLDDIKTRIRYK